MRAATKLCFCLFAVLGCAGFATNAAADAVADFYAGNQINLFVSSATGGGYDNYARLLARHLGRYIPGSPTIVVKNMPGAAGARAANHVYNVAPKDGTSMLMPQNTLSIDQFTAMPSVKFDMRRFEWIGSLNVNQSVCIFSKRVAPLVAEDFFKRKLVLGASGGVTASPALIATLLNQLAGTKFAIVNGYEGTNVAILAIEQGEVDGICGIGWDSVRVQLDDRIRRGDFVVGLDVGVAPDAELARMGVPFLLSLMPDGIERRTLELLLSPQHYGRPFAMAPGTPRDRLEAARAAMERVVSDQSFLAEAERTHLQIQYLPAQQILRYVNVLFDAPPEIRDRAREELRKAGWGAPSGR
jgi:tripartite-type tricarboxylate transporter receptor subunit TctC